MPPAWRRFRAQLAQVRDLERTLGRLSAGTGNARDLAALRLALEQIPALKQTLARSRLARRMRSARVRNAEDGSEPPHAGCYRRKMRLARTLALPLLEELDGQSPNCRTSWS